MKNSLLTRVDMKCMLCPMASMKKMVTFDDFWPTLRDAARDRGWSVGEFMRRCRVPRQRYSEFDGGTRPLTGTYLVKLMEGLRLTQEELEVRAGKKFSAEQIRERKFESWVAAHREVVGWFIDDPELIEIVRSIKDRRR